MIKVNGGKAELIGSDETLGRELAYLIGLYRSRVSCQGHSDVFVGDILDNILSDAKVYDLERLRSEARAQADSERLGGCRRGDVEPCITMG